jgi:hypothetical protein
MNQVANRVYDFRVALAGEHDLTADVADLLYEAGCDDASVWSEGPTMYLDFHREAGSLGDAIGSAIKTVEAAGSAVARVDVEQQPAASS